MTDTPKFENAPGLVVRKRASGSFVAFWQARSDIAKRGYRPQTIPLWRGFDPSDADRKRVSDECNQAQTEMLIWGRGGLPDVTGPYDGTIRSLIHQYKNDPDGRYAKLRYQSRKTYSYFMKYIEEAHGSAVIEDLRGRDFIRWHEAWMPRGTTMAHGLMNHIRTMMTYGATLLDCAHCRRVKELLSDMHFPQSPARLSVLTAEQAAAIRVQAHADGLHSIALAQAIQFDGMLRQKDVIGEWVPEEEPGLSDVRWRKNKWLRGIRWNQIDKNLVLRHTTSKRLKDIEIQLSEAPMVLEEFALIGERPSDGPLIVNERTGRPYSTTQFRALWRDLANKVGIPKNVQQRDSRAGAITEATDAGADLESIRHAAAHSDIATTQRYSRGSSDKAAKVLQMRVEHRKRTENAK